MTPFVKSFPNTGMPGGKNEYTAIFALEPE